MKKTHRRRRTDIDGPWLERVAVAYLQRFSSSSQHLKRVLTRRVDKVAREAARALNEAQDHTAEAQGQAEEKSIEIRSRGAVLIDELVARLLRAGLLDDTAFARGRALALFRQGHGTRSIRQRLRIKGVPDDLIDGAIEAIAQETGEDEGPDPDLMACALRARRKRLGPFRSPADQQARRQKDLAALARAGFAYGVARRIIEASREDVEALAAGRDPWQQ